jgi:tetratricopeptide (TPR) repeat protein
MQYIQEAQDIKIKNDNKYIDDVYAYWTARYFFFTGEFDQAESVAQAQLKAEPKAKNKAKYYNILGTVHTMRQDYKKAISSYEKAIEDFNENDNKKGAALVKSNIANIFFSLSDFESAYKYINQAHEELAPFNDSVNKVNVLGILSISEAKTKRYESAGKHANKTLELSKETDNKNGVALAYLALGEIALVEKRQEDAVANFQRTDSVATLVRNFNLAHLAQVGMLTANVNLKNYPAAREIGEKALADLTVVSNRTTEYVIRKNLAEAHAGLGNFQRAYVLKRAADSIYKETSSIKNKEYINELLIRHDTERKENELKIERKENQIKEARLTQQGWILFALALVLVIAILIFISYRNAQRNTIEPTQNGTAKPIDARLN